MSKSTPPTFNFTVPPELSDWHVSAEAWLKAKNKHFDGLASGALVFKQDDDGIRLLLIQRAPHDSLPLKWEPPGGAVDPTDESILHGCARELWEEAGLEARRMVRAVPETGEGDKFTNRTGTKILCRFTFEVEVEGGGAAEVKLDPEEHVDWYWATREEVEKERREDGRQIPTTTPMIKRILLQGFELRQKRG